MIHAIDNFVITCIYADLTINVDVWFSVSICRCTYYIFSLIATTIAVRLWMTRVLVDRGDLGNFRFLDNPSVGEEVLAGEVVDSKTCMRISLVDMQISAQFGIVESQDQCKLLLGGIIQGNSRKVINAGWRRGDSIRPYKYCNCRLTNFLWRSIRKNRYVNRGVPAPSTLTAIFNRLGKKFVFRKFVRQVPWRKVGELVVSFLSLAKKSAGNGPANFQIYRSTWFLILFFLFHLPPFYLGFLLKSTSEGVL